MKLFNLTNRVGGVAHLFADFGSGLKARTRCGIWLRQWRDADSKCRKCKRCLRLLKGGSR